MRMRVSNIFLSLVAVRCSGLAAGPHDQEGLEKVDYTGHKIVKIFDLDANTIHRLDEAGFDRWALDEKEKAVVYRFTPEQFTNLPEVLERPVAFEVVNDNVQDLIDAEMMDLAQKSSRAVAWFQAYHKFEDIRDWYREMAARSGGLMRYIPEIGKTFEGRSMFAVHIGGRPRRGDQGLARQRPHQQQAKGEAKEAKKPNKIWIQCLIHAREWISGSTCQYIAAQLVQNYHSDGQIRDLLDHNEVIMVPVVNPDGYVHAWTRDRLWRKNRRWFRFGTGVDLNRNFDDHWCETGSSRSPFTDTYCGPEGASESETQAIQNYYGRYKGQMLAAIDMHSFSQLILRPNGYSEEDCPDEARLLEASTILAKGIKSSSGKAYEPKKSAELYPTSGTATDYFYWVPGQEFRPYSITIELRPVASKSYNGFIVDPAQIIPCGEEIMSGLVPFLRYAMENPIQANKTEKIIPRGSSEEARSGQVGLSHKDPTRRLSSLSPNTSSSPADGLLGFLPVYTAHRQDTPSQPAR